MKKIIALAVMLCLVLCSCSPEIKNNSYEQRTENEKESRFTSALWLSYKDLEELLEEADKSVFTDRIESLLNDCAETGINTLIVHAVAFCDAFFDSEILPKSKYISFDRSFDPFEIICSLCQKANVSVEAWINPYRIGSFEDKDSLPDGSPALELGSDSVLAFDGGLYLNPASVEARGLILSYVREIIEKYKVCAIHLDDYFYPTDSQDFDEDSYKNYLSSGGSLNLSDWRRANVASLFNSLHLVTEENGLLLSLSPCADLEKNREKLFADIPYLLENGLVDEVIPQLYFGFENEKMPFVPCLEEWISLCENKNVHLVIGLAAYKCGKEDVYAGSGKNEWIEDGDILSRQMSLILQKNTIYGVSFFSYSYIFGKKAEKNIKKGLQTAKSML